MLSVNILLDRSGSMQSRWKSSIDSINEYVNVLKESNVECKISLYAFDLATNAYIRSMTWGPVSHDIAPVESSKVTEVVRSNVHIDNWAPLTGSEVSPRGSTPLFDAVVETKERIMSDYSEKGIFLIMTDGGENASKNSKNVAEGVISYIKARNWEVVFLGANFDVSHDARGLGIAASNFATFDDSNAVGTMRSVSAKTALYATSGMAINFSDQDKMSYLNVNTLKDNTKV